MNSLKRNLLLIFLSFITWSVKAQTLSIVEQYIQQYEKLAIEEMVRTGIPAAISLAQGIEESHAGTGWLAVNANNQFGIKCKSSWQGQTVSYDDDRRNECFRKYVNDSASWHDHSDFLKNTPRYAFLFYLDPLDYKAWAYGLQDAGYATNKKYAKKLIHLIETYHLQQYSEHGFALMKNTSSESEFATLLNKKIKEDQREKEIFETTSGQEKNRSNQTPLENYPAGIFEVNDRKAVYLTKGTQLLPVAEEYHIRLGRLLRYNGLASDVLKENRVVYLEKKKGGFWNWVKHIFSGGSKKGEIASVSEATYHVEPGDTLYSISQKYGITVRELRKANHLNSNTIFAGQKLVIPKN